MTDSTVDVEVLARDATQYWSPWKDRLDLMKGKVDTALTAQDFSLIPGASDVFTAFEDAQSRLEVYIGGGVTAFQSFHDLLKETAVDYLEEEGASAAEVSAFSARFSS